MDGPLLVSTTLKSTLPPATAAAASVVFTIPNLATLSTVYGGVLSSSSGSFGSVPGSSVHTRIVLSTVVTSVFAGTSTLTDKVKLSPGSTACSTVNRKAPISSGVETCPLLLLISIKSCPSDNSSWKYSSVPSLIVDFPLLVRVIVYSNSSPAIATASSPSFATFIRAPSSPKP